MTKRKITRTLVGVVLVVIAAALAFPALALGGTIQPSYKWYSDSPQAEEFIINNPADLAGFADIVNGTNGQIANSFTGKTVKLSTSGDFANMHGNALTPIGTAEHPFAGTFDGSNKVLGNFTIETEITVGEGENAQTTYLYENLGVFGYVTGSIQNVTVGNGATLSMSRTADQIHQIKNIGLLVGYCQGSLTNCTSNGRVTVAHAMSTTKNIVYAIQNVGNLAGYVEGGMSGCSNTGALSVTETGSPYTVPESESEERNQINSIAINIGGIAGCVGSEDTSVTSTSAKTQGNIANCNNSGALSVDVPSQNGKDRFGNIVYAQATCVGAIAGYARGNVSDCSNSATLKANHATALGGIIGSLRGSSESSNFSAAGSDDGMLDGAPVLTLSGCQNYGNMVGYAQIGGIVGKAGTYTSVSESLNGNGSTRNPLIIGTRSTKPFVGGIVGSTYGTVSYNANFGDQASAVGADPIDVDLGLYTVGGGYYVSGIVGLVQYYTNENGRNQPLPEVYACYNAGSVIASTEKMRQRALVGDNEGYVHDCISVENCGTSELFFTESNLGTTKNCYMVAENCLKTNASFVEQEVTHTALSVLNNNGDAEQWDTYWTISKDGVNGGYFALDRQVSWTKTSITAAEVTLVANAEYSGLQSVPKATVKIGRKTLTQGVDFKIVPQPKSATDCIEVTAAGEYPYSAKIIGLGSYEGEATTLLSYGVARGDLANCTVIIASKPFNWQVQTPAKADVAVLNPAGAVVNSSEYSVALDETDANLTNGKAVNAKSYKAIITANQDSTHFYGTNKTGKFVITAVKIVWSEDNDDNATVEKISYNGKEYTWQSTSNSAITDENRQKFAYTGHSILPSVTKVTYLGQELVQGRDYRVVYGKSSTMGDPESSLNPNIEVGEGWVTVRYVSGGNFTNYDMMEFAIVESTGKLDISEATVQGDSDVIFEEGSTYEPLTVWYGGSQLVKGTDYTISYTDNNKIGKASYTITGCGTNFTGSKSGHFNIVAGIPYTLLYDCNDTNKTATVTGVEYLGSNKTFNLVIPASITNGGKTYDVVAIADRAFGGQSALDFTGNTANESKLKIKSVVIPRGVESIGAFAFGSAATEYTMAQLTSVTLEENSKLTSIGNGAFSHAGVTSIEIPARVATIGSLAFAQCPLTTLTFRTDSATQPTMNTTYVNNSFYGVSNVKAYSYDEATAVRTFIAGKLVAGWSWTSLGSAPAVVRYGDVNDDTKVNSIDAMLIAQYAVQLIDKTKLDLLAGDINGDTKVNSIDAMLVAQYTVGIITKFPIEQ